MKLSSDNITDSRSRLMIDEPLDLSHYCLDSPYDRLKCLFHIVVSSPFTESEQLSYSMLLDMGLKVLGMEEAVVVRELSPKVGEIATVRTLCQDFYIGQHIRLANSIPGEVLDSESAVWGDTDDYSYAFFDEKPVGRFIALPVISRTSKPLALCFFSSTEHSIARPHNKHEDLEFINLLSEGVASMIDLQASKNQRKAPDQAAFADGSIKSLEEYVQQATLPSLYGVPAKVVEVLESRIGHAPLSIGSVAEELNLSKRTLQRRLHQQDICFAELRDQVRFNHSIGYLVKHYQSIDAISSSLDFSDRTSFTNAFKRWTGLSPSTFRKLFRDYV